MFFFSSNIVCAPRKKISYEGVKSALLSHFSLVSPYCQIIFKNLEKKLGNVYSLWVFFLGFNCHKKQKVAAEGAGKDSVKQEQIKNCGE